jgi:hypothetical protein
VNMMHPDPAADFVRFLSNHHAVECGTGGWTLAGEGGDQWSELWTVAFSATSGL